MDVALLENGWAQPEDLVGISDIDKQSLLSLALSEVLNSEEHSVQDLQSRDVSAASGGLCGMAAIYQALHETLLTKSQLQKMTHLTMKERIFMELKLDPKLSRKEADTTVLKWFHQLICHHQKDPTSLVPVLSRKRRDVSFLVEPMTSKQQFLDKNEDRNSNNSVLYGNAFSCECDLTHDFEEPDSKALFEPMAKRQRIRRQTKDDTSISFYGNTLTYECGLARRFKEPESNLLYDTRSIVCNWNKTWTPYTEIDPCIWVACINPPDPPFFTNLVVEWDGVPINFTNNISYTCDSDFIPHYFESDRDLQEYNISCLGGRI